MKTALDLEQLGKLIKDTELGLAKIQLKLRETNAEVGQLSAMEQGLEENVDYLKQSHSTVSASEFKKIKEDLTRIKGRISLLRIDLDAMHRAEDQARNSLDELKKEYAEKATGPNNILSFRGKKK